MNPDYSYKPEGRALPKLAIFYKAIHMLSFFLFLGFANPAVGQALDAAALLKQLKSLDSVYEATFTASGSYLFVASFFPPDLPPLRKKWQLTMSNGKIAYEEEVIEVLKWEDVLSPNQDIPERRQTGSLRSRGEPMTALRTTYFFGPTAQAKYDFVGKIPPYGLLPPWPENSPGLATAGSLAFDDPDTGAYRFDIRRTLWSLGRGYSAYITNIKDVAKQEDGLISVIAEATDISSRQGAKWELVIDPSAAYMVRSAKLYRMGTNQPQPTISIVNSGVKWHGSRCVPEKSEWKDSYVGGRSISNEFHSASSEADMEFLKHAEGTMRRPYLVHTDVADLRMTPELTVQYRAGDLFPKGRKGLEEAILFEQFEKSNDKTGMPSSTRDISSQSKESRGQDVRTADVEAGDIQTPLGVQDLAKGRHSTKLVVAWIILIATVIIGAVYLTVRIGLRKTNHV